MIRHKSIILLSGGLDSATTLSYSLSKGHEAHCLIFDYGQRHKKEIIQAVKIAKRAKCPFKIVTFTLPWQGSSLLDKNIPLPQRMTIDPKEIPSTYVPARNIIFLSFAASFAEAVGAKRIFIGANAIDYSGYPDCRPEFFEAFQKALRSGMKTGTEGNVIKIEAPLLYKTKAQIIKLAKTLKVPIDLTWSCYAGAKKACGVCDSCLLRQKGFEEIGLKDEG